MRPQYTLSCSNLLYLAKRKICAVSVQQRTENGKQSTPSASLVSSSPDVKLGSLTLIRYKMTLSHFSKDLIRPVSGGQ